MSKSEKRNKDIDKSYTYDEYLNTFFPDATARSARKQEEPDKIGIYLAQDSLIKMHEILSGTVK